MYIQPALRGTFSDVGKTTIRMGRPRLYFYLGCLRRIGCGFEA